jgi:hypothetical protein
MLPQDQEESEIQKKFFDHREFNVVWANRNLEEWMHHREAYARDFLIPKALELNIVLYPHKGDHNFIYLNRNFTSSIVKWNQKEKEKQLVLKN